MEAFGIFEHAWVLTWKGHVKANPTPSFHQHAVDFSSKGHCRWPATDILVILCKIRGSHLCAANARRRNNAARCKRELHFYCSVAPERLLNSLWKCWQKRSRFNKACSSGEEQQPTVRWGGWVWSYGLWILMMVQWSRYANQQCSFSPASAEKSGCVQTGNLCRVSTPHFFFSDPPPPTPPHALAPLLPLTVLPLEVSPRLTFHTSSSCFNTPWHEDVYFWLCRGCLYSPLTPRALPCLLSISSALTDDK